jgi:peptidoglycan/xylan/chitin deacetylase (PgdA/CDA1 family)
VLLFHWLGFSRVRNACVFARKTPATQVLVFHDVVESAVQTFRRNLQFLKEHTNVVGLSEYLSGRLCYSRLNVVLTFDDGYKGWVSHALPVLRELELAATFFVCSGLVGLEGAAAKEFVSARLRTGLPTTGPIDLDGLRGLVKEGYTIGGHTRQHVDMTAGFSRAILREEIVSDRAWLQERTGQSIEVFAYPFGFFRHPGLDLALLLKDAGYLAALTVAPGFNWATSPRYLLHREIVHPEMAPAIFRARVLGNHDGVRALRRALRVPEGFSMGRSLRSWVKRPQT